MNILRNLFTFPVVCYVLIPIGVMLISWTAQRSFKLKLNAGSELFAFGFALDLDLLLNQGTAVGSVTPDFRADFGGIFGVALLISVGFLIFSAKVQSEIMSRRHSYPVFRVAVCWMFSIAIIGFHLYALLRT